MSGFEIGAAQPADAAAIRRLHEASFPTAAEAALVERLQSGGDAVLSLVARRDGVVAGHILFSRMAAPDNPDLRVVALGPLAVPPEQQRGGVGSALLRAGLEHLGQGGWDLVLVLGEPAYYGRFGFTAEAAAPFSTPYDGPYLQALALSEAGRAAGGVLTYAPAFADLG